MLFTPWRPRSIKVAASLGTKTSVKALKYLHAFVLPLQLSSATQMNLCEVKGNCLSLLLCPTLLLCYIYICYLILKKPLFFFSTLSLDAGQIRSEPQHKFQHLLIVQVLCLYPLKRKVEHLKDDVPTLHVNHALSTSQY